MTATLLRQFVLFALLLAFAVPVPALAASDAMRRASQTLLGKGLAASDEKRAKRLFEQAIVADPANAAALSALGGLYARQGQAPMARKYYDIALSVDPTDPAALYGSAELDLAEGKTGDAADRLRILKTACPACRETHDLDRKLSAPSSSHP